MITPKYDNGAYIDGSRREIAKKRSKYPKSPTTPFNPSDSVSKWFDIDILLTSNPVNKREPGK